MNSRRVSLLLLAVNFGLLIILAYIVYSIRLNPEAMTGTVRTAVLTNTVTQIAVRKINSTNNLLASLAGRPLSWRALESTNYVQFIENLRAFACPEETVRDIIITDVAKMYARRRAALRGELQPYKFWQTMDLLGGPAESPELQRQLRALDIEQRQLIRALLDVDLRTELAKYSGNAERTEQTYEFLPQDKQDQVSELTEQFDEMEQDLFTRSRGWLLDEDMEELKLLQRQRRVELASLLSAEEMEEYELRYSDTADNMRSQLSGFQPSEEEFREIFRLQRTYDLQIEMGFDERDPAAQAAKSRAQQQALAALAAEIQKNLGPERFGEYTRAQDGDYRALLQLGERLEMPRQVADQVYNMKQAVERYKYQVESNPNLTDAQRAQAVAAMARETERAIGAAMGDEVFKIYRNSSGRWLTGLGTVDESVVPVRPPQPTGTVLDYDVNLLPPYIRNLILNPFPQPIQPIQPTPQ